MQLWIDLNILEITIDRVASVIEPMTRKRRVSEICSANTVNNQTAVRHSSMARKISSFLIQAPGFGIMANANGKIDIDK